MGAYAPPTGRNTLKCKKVLKKIDAYISTLIGASQVSWKTDMFCVLCKKTKKMYRESIFRIKFCLNTHDTKNVVFS